LEVTTQKAALPPGILRSSPANKATVLDFDEGGYRKSAASRRTFPGCSRGRRMGENAGLLSAAGGVKGEDKQRTGRKRSGSGHEKGGGVTLKDGGVTQEGTGNCIRVETCFSSGTTCRDRIGISTRERTASKENTFPKRRGASSIEFS